MNAGLPTRAGAVPASGGRAQRGVAEFDADLFLADLAGTGFAGRIGYSGVGRAPQWRLRTCPLQKLSSSGDRNTSNKRGFSAARG